MSLNVDHPKAFKYLSDEIERQFKEKTFGGVTQDWLIKQLSIKIEEGEQGEPLNDLIALQKDLDDPNTLSGFGMHCLELAGAPAEFWNNTKSSQETYSELLKHPALQQS
jgi:hypothetical protein